MTQPPGTASTWWPVVLPSACANAGGVPGLIVSSPSTTTSVGRRLTPAARARTHEAQWQPGCGQPA
jgi:hypothetical protein